MLARIRRPRATLTTPMTRLPALDPRIPQWGTDLVEHPCPMCGAAGGEEIAERPDGLFVQRCEACGCLFVSPAPAPTVLTAFYEAYSSHATWAPPEDRLRALRSLRPRADPRTAALVRLLGGVRGRKVLDIGFGAGQDLARFAELGAEVSGVDLDPESVRFAVDRMGVQAHLGTAAEAPQGTHDLTLLHDVVEHQLDPLGALADALGTLRIGGLLSIWTPNGEVVEQDPEPVTLRVDLEHLVYLRSADIRRAAKQLGASVVHLDTLGHPALDAFTGPPRRPRVLRRVAEVGLPSAVLRGLRGRHQARGAYHLFAVVRRDG